MLCFAKNGFCAATLLWEPDDLSENYVRLPASRKFVELSAVRRKAIPFEMDKYSLMITDWWLNG